jgi:hypothetical protein
MAIYHTVGQRGNGKSRGETTGDPRPGHRTRRHAPVVPPLQFLNNS